MTERPEVTFTRTERPLPGGRALIWQDGAFTDPFLDPGLAGQRLDLKGLDAATASPCGTVAALYARNGTRGSLLSGGQVLRELTRDAYHAAAYPFPVALGTRPDGTVLLAWCPLQYDGLVVEEAISGRVVAQTTAGGQQPDIFHSQLQFSQDARWLLSNGWVWHPYTVQAVCDLDSATPGTSIESTFWQMPVPEKDTAADRMGEPMNSCLHGQNGQEQLIAGDEHGTLWSWDLHRPGTPTGVHTGLSGELLPCGPGRVLALHTHPRLLDIQTGEVLAEWPDLDTGLNTGPLWSRAEAAVAVHPEGTSFAALQGETLHLIELNQET